MRTLISTSTLSERLDDPSFVVLDCRFQLAAPDWGEQEWAAGHIPGAAYVHLDRDLSGPRTGANGRHPLPDVAALAVTFGRLGITDGVQVVAYDQDSGMFASRLWWLLRWLGHDAVAVLDGGMAKWLAEGRPVSRGAEGRQAAVFRPDPRPQMMVDAAQVAAHVGDLAAGWRLVDARAPERYRGDIEPLDRVAGHIPGAANHFYLANLDERGTFRTPDELRGQLRAALGDVDPARVVCYCGSGVTACHNLLALEHAGLAGAKLYPGSWSEWSSDVARPVETTPRTTS
jgi:thiosulfate/3-mercaptopyruvate sulfurtransferase